MGLLKEFKEFALRGNVVDMAVGIIIGGAFGKIVASLVNDVVMPPLGYVLTGVDFKDKSVVLKEAVEGVSEAIVWKYGMFINTVLDFLIVALCVFAAIKLMNTLKRKEEESPKPPEPTAQEKLLTEIRDLLRAQA
jgi:large conductance mechanosensitive channel